MCRCALERNVSPPSGRPGARVVWLGGGGGGGQKNVLGAVTNFALKIGVKTKKIKKDLYPQTVPSFRAQLSLMGQVHSMAGRGATESYGAVLGFFLKFRGEDKKKQNFGAKF